MICARRRAIFDPLRHQRGLDARDPDSPFHAWARNKIAKAAAGDGAAVNTVVVSESSVRSKNPDAVPAIIQAMGLALRVEGV